MASDLCAAAQGQSPHYRDPGTGMDSQQETVVSTLEEGIAAAQSPGSLSPRLSFGKSQGYHGGSEEHSEIGLRDAEETNKRLGDIEAGSHGSGAVRVLSTSGSNSSSKERMLWHKLESIMAARQPHVQQVLAEFGVSGSQSASDELEEHVWKVVQGELSLQEATDLV